MKTEASQNLWKRVLFTVGYSCSEGSAEGSLFVLKFLASSLLLDMRLQFQILSQILLNHVNKQKPHYQLLKKDGKELVVDLLLSMSLYGIRSRKVGSKRLILMKMVKPMNC